MKWGSDIKVKRTLDTTFPDNISISTNPQWGSHQGWRLAEGMWTFQGMTAGWIDSIITVPLFSPAVECGAWLSNVCGPKVHSACIYPKTAPQFLRQIVQNYENYSWETPICWISRVNQIIELPGCRSCPWFPRSRIYHRASVQSQSLAGATISYHACWLMMSWDTRHRPARCADLM